MFIARLYLIPLHLARLLALSEPAIHSGLSYSSSRPTSPVPVNFSAWRVLTYSRAVRFILTHLLWYVSSNDLEDMPRRLANLSWLKFSVTSPGWYCTGTYILISNWPVLLVYATNEMDTSPISLDLFFADFKNWSNHFSSACLSQLC